MTTLCTGCGVLLLDEEIEESQKQKLVPICADCMNEVDSEDLRRCYGAEDNQCKSDNTL